MVEESFIQKRLKTINLDDFLVRCKTESKEGKLTDDEYKSIEDAVKMINRTLDLINYHNITFE